MSEQLINLMKSDRSGWRLLVNATAKISDKLIYDLSTYGCTEFYIEGHIPAVNSIDTIQTEFLQVQNWHDNQVNGDITKENYYVAHLWLINGSLCGQLYNNGLWGKTLNYMMSNALKNKGTTIAFGVYPAPSSSDIEKSIIIYGR